jgi:hypothetical protein
VVSVVTLAARVTFVKAMAKSGSQSMTMVGIAPLTNVLKNRKCGE